jgi:hypothetical protein
MKTDPAAYAGKGVFSQKGLKGIVISSLTCQVEKLGNRISRRTSFLAWGSHERRLWFLETPFPSFDNFRASIRNGNHKLRRMIEIRFQSPYASESFEKIFHALSITRISKMITLILNYFLSIQVGVIVP